jgi:hypothetical protein
MSLTRKLLAALLVFGMSLSSQAQVYAIGVRGGPMTTLRVDDERFFLKDFPNPIGIVAYRAVPDWQPQTEVYLGNRTFTFRMPPYRTSTAVLLCAFVLLIPATGRTRRGFLIENNRTTSGRLTAR